MDFEPYVLIKIVEDPKLPLGVAVMYQGGPAMPDILKVSQPFYLHGNLINPLEEAKKHYGAMAQMMREHLKENLDITMEDWIKKPPQFKEDFNGKFRDP